MNSGAFIKLLSSYVGQPAIRYSGRLNGCSTDGFDCSGFVGFVLRQAGYPDNIPRHANELFDCFGILIHSQFRRAGDLVFFSRNGTYPTHVGIMISQNQYIHSPGKDNTVVCAQDLATKVVKSKNPAWQIYHTNPIGFKRITVGGKRFQQMFLT